MDSERRRQIERDAYLERRWLLAPRPVNVASEINRIALLNLAVEVQVQRAKDVALPRAVTADERGELLCRGR